MAVTKKDLEEMMKIQKEERKNEMNELKTILMDGVREEMKEQLDTIRLEMDEKVSAVRQELKNKLLDVDKKQTEMSDVQSVRLLE